MAHFKNHCYTVTPGCLPTGGKACSYRWQQSVHPAASLQHSGRPAADGGEDDGHSCASNDRTNENNPSSSCRGHSAPNQAGCPARYAHTHQEIRFVHLSCSSLWLSHHQLSHFSLLYYPQSGLSSLFEDANLCGLYSEERLVLDDARHRAFLALTEQGVEAGAVTSISFSRTHSSFSALQPFIMLLWSDQANVPLFIGRVTDPWERESVCDVCGGTQVGERERERVEM